jgi:anti-sigma B factor antagonist
MSSILPTPLENAVSLVRLAGEFDVADAPQLVTALDEAIADETSRTIAIDLSEVSFLDSTMLQTLVSARDRAQLARKPVWIVRPEPVVWRVFKVTLLDKLFRDFESLAALEDYAAASLKTLNDAPLTPESPATPSR